MPVPVQFTVCTYNIWTWTRWPERRDALRAFVAAHRPDLLCVQELQEESKAVIDDVLGSTHERVDDAFAGWTCEDNLWWNRSIFTRVAHGAEDVGICEEHRRLFWARLALAAQPDHTLVVSTAHWTWHGHRVAVETEKNVRLPQARATVAALDALRVGQEAQLFMGDLNDTNEPIFVLQRAGLTDCFGALARTPRATYPARPTAQGPDQTIDWIFARGPLEARSAEVVDFWHGDLAASDHKPVLATYALEG